jgi:hypothetical protein
MHPVDCLCCQEHGKEKGPDGYDAAERKCIEDIEKFGLSIWQISPGEGDDGFSYTVGLFGRHGHPEIVVFGQKPAWQAAMLNLLAEDIQAGKSFGEGALYSDLLPGYQCRFKRVDAIESYRDYLGWDLWYYETVKQLDTPFFALQLIWPDKNGVFPDSPGYNSYRQPILP